MRHFLLCILILAAPICRADTVTFRSGEHPGFSRLVLAIPAGARWRLGRDGEDYALQLASQDVFDTSAAFDRIPRDRLVALTGEPGTGRLLFDIACDCHATAFLFAPGQLVIDIADGPAPADSPFEAALAGTTPIETAQTERATVSGTGLQPQPESLRGLALLPDPLANAANAAPRVSAAQVAIVDSLARAATQGLLDIDLTHVPDMQDDHGADHGPAAPAEVFPTQSARTAPATAVADVDTHSPGISVETAVDRDRTVSAASPETTLSGSACLDDRLFDLASWGDDSGFAAQIGARRSALTTERDLVPEGAVEALAQTYLFFGFGAEAEQALGLDGLRSPEREVLRAIARIVDEEPLASTVFEGQTGCERPVALWSALARNSLAGTTEAERIAIQAAHRVLPLPVRRSIGTRLAQLFLDGGMAATAQDIIAASESARDEQPSDPTLTEAEVALAVEDPESAIATLEELATDHNRMTPEALVTLIDLSVAEDRPVGDDLLEMAATLRFEHRDTPAETDLGLAALRALTHDGRFAQALTLLSDELPNLSPEVRAEQVNAIITAAATTLADPAFVDFAFGDLPQPLPGAAENALAKRLLDLGFVDVAAAMVAGPAETAAMAERRGLRARASVALGQIDEAEAQLLGRTGPDIAAISGLPSADQPPADAESLWRAGDWRDLGGVPDPLLQAASQAMLAGPATPAPDGTLAERQALLEQAAATRDLATGLLERFAIDAAGGEQPAN